MVDLTTNSKKVTTPRSNFFQKPKHIETSRSTMSLYAVERHPVITGVSVQALVSYPDIVSLSKI